MTRRLLARITTLLTLCAPSIGLLAVGAVLAPLPAQGTPIGFDEDFALAADRTKALAQLVPGTEDYYFYSCLDAQHRGAFGEVAPLLKTWIQRHGRTARVMEIENRQALLDFDRDPAASYAFLRERLGVSYGAQRQARGERTDLATRLDPEQVSFARFTERAFAGNPQTLDGFTPRAFPILVGSTLDDARLFHLLRRLDRPDLPNLPALIVRNLQNPQSQGFGSLPIHGLLLLTQLEECLRLRPQLLNESAFVETYVQRLAPNADQRIERDAEAREACLDRLAAFAQRLSPVHNSLKAHVLYHRLVHDLGRGVPDRARFVEYLRLPRSTGYVNPDLLRRTGAGFPAVDLSQDFPTALGRIGDDEPLVRAYLMHFFVDEGSYRPFAEFVRDDYLRRVFAEAKILAGVGDMEQWYSLLNDPAYYEALKERVEIGFPPTSRSDFASDEAVSIEVDVKNVTTLLVKVFEIDTFAFHKQFGRDVDASIDLDGLVANQEATYTYAETPFRRVRRRFDFPALAKPGTFVIDFIGNGLSSRAVIQKGRLQVVERDGAAGHVLRVLDEAGIQQVDVSAWLGGREFAADKGGEIVMPYATEASSATLILRRGDQTSVVPFGHAAESYALEAGIYVDREQLIVRRKAHVVVRPLLTLNGNRVAISLLEDPELSIVAVDQDGVVSTQYVRDLELTDARDFVHEVGVPEGLASLQIGLRGRVRMLSTGARTDLNVSAAPFAVNAIDATAETGCPVLGRSAGGYVLDVLGKTGEPKPGQVVSLAFSRAEFVDTMQLALQTDDRGRIELGGLDGIASLTVSGFAGESRTFPLRDATRTYPSELHGVVGGAIRVPFMGRGDGEVSSLVSILETRRGVFVRDAIEHATLESSFVVLRGLEPGDYDLWLREADRHIAVRVTAGQAKGDLAIGRRRLLGLSRQGSLQLTDVDLDGERLRVHVANAAPDARVIVVATRYLPAFDPFASLALPRWTDGRVLAMDGAESSYHAGREIGDEFRYILDRRYTVKYPGNMLRRPGLLLNPWARDELDTGIGASGSAGGRFGGRGGRPAASPAMDAARRERSIATDAGTFANVDFLPLASAMVANLGPDADGFVTVPVADLAEGSLIHLIAVDGVDTVYRTLVRAEVPLAPRDRRLRNALDAKGHFTEQRRIEFVDAGGSATIADVTTSTTETYDSLTKVFRLFQTLTHDADLNEFAFVLRWSELSADAKLDEYGRHACHELNVFLHQKDPAFFAATIRPYLANKADKTFVDRWLLDEDLRAYLEPWAFGQLNVVERVLLGRRVDRESGAVARHLRDLLELEPQDLDRMRFRFESLLKSTALDAEAAKLGGEADKQDVELKLAAGEEAGAAVRELRRAAAKVPGGPTTPGPAGPATAGPPRAGAGGGPAARKPAAPSADAAPEPAASDEYHLGAGVVAERQAELEDLERRKDARAFYRAPERTRAFVENNYWHRTMERSGPEMIGVNAFWTDFAEATPARPFVSSNVAAATGSFAEMMLALAVLDLPYQAGQHVVDRDGDRLTLRAASPLLLVRKEIQSAAPAGGIAPILVSQNFFRLDDRYRFEGAQQVDNYVTDEFVVGVGYGCRVVLTNPTSMRRRLELLLQVPEGALPVQRGFYTRGITVDLDPFATRSVEYSFYFALPGSFAHFPVHVARDGELIAFASPLQMNVVATPSTVDTTSWDHLSQDGSREEVIQYLATHNLERIELPKIAWRMTDRGFFTIAIGELRKRHAYDTTLWSYGLLHGDESVSREYLRQLDAFVATCGRALRSRLLTIDPVERRAYQHIEYDPVFNPRAHRFGKRREILNAGIAGQYLSLLSVLSYRPTLDAPDWMSVTYYLLLQDRIGEAIAAFAKVDPSRLTTRLQYDYMRAYLDFFTAEHAAARGIAETYRDHPVPRWRAMFRDVLNQLDEIEGKAVAVSDAEDRTQQQTALAASEPALELSVEARRVTIRHQNLERCEVSYYRMDIEFSFSTRPFVQQGDGSFAYVRPNRRDEVALAKGSGETAFDLPEEFRSANVLVEVRGGGVARRQAYFANSLSVQTFESFGQLRVTGATSGQPLPQVYVKVYAREPNGRVRFHKDGYTDLRGRFDYASVSGEGLAGAERYSILVLSESDGAVIREVSAPPK